MSAALVIAPTTLSGAGSAQVSLRLTPWSRSHVFQIDTDGTLVLGAVTIEVRLSHPNAVGGGGWVDYTAELTPVGDDLTAGQGSSLYNLSFSGAEEIRFTIPWSSGSGDVSLTRHAIP